jgi:PAS domain S-box-containing protein
MTEPEPLTKKEPELFTNRDLFELLVRRLRDFVVVLMDRHGNFLSWHEGVGTRLGYSADEFIGRSGEILLPVADRLKGVFPRDLQRATETGVSSDTTWLVTKTGRPIFVDGVTLALHHPKTHELLGFGKVIRDITERKNTEDSLRALAQALDQSVVFITDWNGTIEHWTSGCQRLYGWTAEEAVGRAVDELLRTAESVPIASIQTQLIEEGTWQGELHQKRKDSTSVYVSAHWTMFSENRTQQPGIIATHTDITPRVQVQHELESANQRLRTMAVELERSNAELEEFARIASHDLSAPITSARWLVELPTSRHAQQLDADGQSYVRQISLGLARMTDLVEAILAHATVGKNPIGTIEPVNADEAFDMAASNLQKDLNFSGAQLSRDPLPKLFIDAQPLAQLFQNLLSNAIKYRRQEVPLCIHVSAIRQEQLWMLCVKDNGMGIEPQWLERIFLPLQRLSRPDIAGSGIGLATCRKIVDRAGGRIWAESEPGVGSTFCFTLPGPAAQQ